MSDKTFRRVVIQLLIVIVKWLTDPANRGTHLGSAYFAIGAAEQALTQDES